MATIALVAVASAPPSAAAAPTAPATPTALRPDTAAGADSGTATRTDGGLAKLLAGIAGEAAPLGHSGRLRARFLAGAVAERWPGLARLFGPRAAEEPGVHALRMEADAPFSLVTLVPFSAKERGRIGGYRMGYWPVERGTASRGAYANPAGFIRVTPENQDTYVSEHFRLRDFLTHDQRAVWPKYLVLREPLLDKLELLIQELSASGTPVRHLTVMSGFRTPQYNDQGVGAGGRAQNSRHQYGDAADVFVDNDRNGRLDDLNGDGRVDTRDVRVMLAAVERVERRYPDLLGGAGVYRATSAHGPFVHVDVRGTRARW
ncbi:MAG TPA: D-Ala-D-Ala carboxypeptidase family metallohydrolase [Gemmatimonadaceae bacterium]